MNIQVFSDGGARGNPGPAGIGYLITSSEEVLYSGSKYIGETTNNVAEYLALIEALKYLLSQKLKIEKVVFFLDSELVVKQLNQQYKVKKTHLLTLFQEVIVLVGKICNPSTNAEFKHIPREENQKADYLVNQAIDSYLKTSY